jgi:subtilisin family serine protease
MSFGGPGGGGAEAFFQDLIDQALAAGITCVAAAGNNDTAELMYPAACDGVISVGATDASGARSSFSTYGAWVTVNAPGSQIWSTIQTNYEFDWLSALLFSLSYGWDGVNPYMNSDGTSMACPMVAGVAGLVLSRAPGLSPAEVEQLLVATGDNVAYDQPLGVKVNAEAAIMALDVTAAPDAPAGLLLAASPNPFNPRTTVQLALPRASSVWLEIVDVQGRRVRTLVAGEVLQAGSHTRLWDGAGDDGRAMPSGVYLARVRTDAGVQASKLTLAR